MIIIEVCSGLGNQMFRYAFARSLELETGENVYFSTRIFKRENRKYGLNHLNIKQPAGFIPSFFMTVYTAVYTIFRRIMGFSLYKKDDCVKFFEKTGFYKTALRKYIEIPKSRHFIKYYNANFQCYEYFKKYEDTIKEELKIKSNPSIQNADMLDRIKKSNAVCLHIRRGDYLENENSAVFNVCTPQYYKEAISYIDQMVENPVYFVFSEDIEWAKRQGFQGNIVYVDLNNPDFEELRLMYSCKHFIISNSTFSWWAQFLAANEHKIVVAPGKWTNDSEDNENSLYMNSWHIINID